MTYSILEYQRMFQDAPRHEAYVEALRRSIKPGDVVIEIGTGFGVYAVLAAKFGASKVYAIEMNELVRLGPAVAKANGVGDVVEFFEMMSTDFHPPELADVVFADMRGATPLYGMNVESMHDAAKRFVKPGGVLIPSHDVMEASLISLPDECADVYSSWDTNPMGFDLRAVRDQELTAMRSDRVLPEDLLTASEVVHVARFGTDVEGQFETRWTSTVQRTDTAVGLACWFTGNLVEELTVGPSPFKAPTVYNGAVLLFQEPLQVVAGSQVECLLRAKKRGGSLVWTWSVSQQNADGSLERRVNSTMLNVVLTQNVLALVRPDRIVPVTDDLCIDLAILECFKAGMSVGQTTEHLWMKYPDALRSTEGAKGRVVAVANRYQRLGRV
jgi:Ribosomal protein L11 methyltransferase (PrmA)